MELETQQTQVQVQTRTKNAIWTNTRFLVLWLCSGLTSLAFSVYLLSESWYVVQKLDLEVWLGIVLMVTTIPRVLLMMVGGVLADRLTRSKILSVLNISRGVMIAAMVVLLSFNALSIWGLLGFALFFGILDGFFWPANGSLLPNLVEKDQLVRGNSIIQTTNQLCFLLGPALAGVLLKFASYEVAFGVSGALLLAGGIVIRSIRETPAARDDKKNSKLMLELKEGIAYIKSFPFMLTLMGMAIIVNLLLAGPLNAGLPILVKTMLNGDVLALSYLECSFALGLTAGAVMVGIMNIKRKRGVLAMGLIVLLGIATGSLSQIVFLWQGIALMFAAGFFLSFSNILTSSLIQQMVRPEMMGRVQGVLSTASMGFIPISYALVSVLLSIGISISTLLLVSCTIMVVYVLSILAKVKVVWTTD
jgi:DHA3 family macrolide efflux protein-like MFS transporter